MIRRVAFEVVGIPAPKGSTKAFMRPGARFPIVTHDNPRTKLWQALVSEQAQRVAGGELFLGPVALVLVFELPRPKSLARRVVDHTKKPDLSKLVRCAEDALTGILLRDDRQVVAIEAHKRYAPEGLAPHTTIVVMDAIAPAATQLGLLEGTV